MGQSSGRVVPYPWVRKLVVDAGAAARRRHPVHGLIEVDVTAARQALQAHRATTGEGLSFTAFVVSCVARAVAAEPMVQAYRDLRGRLVIFDSVDVALPIEVSVRGVPFAFTHVIRDADRRLVQDIHREIRDIQDDPTRSPSLRNARAASRYVLLPGPARGALLGLLHRLPTRQRALAGTVGVTAVGMFGAGGGWGIAFQLHTLSVVIGGISVRPALSDGHLVDREHLHLTVSVDHDIVDGAPTARFVRRLRQLLESASGVTVPAVPHV